jgi:hypothetical protein
MKLRRQVRELLDDELAVRLVVLDEEAMSH